MLTIPKKPISGHPPHHKRLSTLQLIAVTLCIASSNTHSLDYEFGDFSLDLDTTLTYGVQYRIESRDKKISQGSDGSDGQLDSLPQLIDNAFIINGNDGNNNFDTGVVSNRVSALSEFDLKSEKFGIFGRVKAYYDKAYDDNTDMSDLNYFSYNANPRFGSSRDNTAAVGEFNPDASDYMKSDIQALDLFLYTSVDVGESQLNLRIGRQVISWGESLLSGGGISSAQNHVDAQIRNTPGLEIKEIFLPNGALLGAFDIGDSVTVQAYYQYEWQENVLDPSSTYFSEFDSIGEGGNTFIFLTGEEQVVFGKDLSLPENAALKEYLPKDDCTSGDKCEYLISQLAEENKASDSGQFGLAMQYAFDSGDELGIYFVNYHEKTPSFILPLDAIDTYAPMVNLLLDPLGDPNDPVFSGPEDLSSDLTTQQLSLLLDFLGAIPEGGGTISEVMTNMGVTETTVGTIDFGADAIQNVANDVLIDSGISSGINANLQPLDYSLDYFEDIRLWGVSYSTVVGNANVAGEISYRENTPIMRGNVARTPDREEVWHLHLNTIMLFEPNAFWDSSSLTAEIVNWWIPGRKNFNANDMSNPDRLAVQNTHLGTGVSMLWNVEYQSVYPGLDIIIPLYVNYGLDGAMFTTGYREKQATVATGVTAKYLGNLEVGVDIATYFGDKDDIFQRMTSDRDNIALKVKYGF